MLLHTRVRREPISHSPDGDPRVPRAEQRISDPLHTNGPGRAKEQHLPWLGHLRRDRVAVTLETHIKHPVGLIEH
jgi:hypothetical protein